MISAAEAAAAARSLSASPVSACQNRFAVEVLMLGEDAAPVAGVALELRQGNACLRSRTSAEGVARFDGLDASTYTLCPCELDLDAWTLEAEQPLSEDQARSAGKANWASATDEDIRGGTLHTAAADDSVDRLALAHGLFPATVWQHPRNDALRKARQSRNVLAQGDVLFIPAIRRKTIAVQPKVRYILKRHGVPSRLRLRLLDDFQPLADLAWTLAVPGEATVQGRTDADGVLQAWVSAAASSAVLSYIANGALRELNISLGALLPGRVAGGWRQRLRNLGFACDAEDRQPLSAADQRAIGRFQEYWGLPVTGTADAITIEKIRSVHDGRQAAPPAHGKYASGS
jgi:hypothetical protein